ncbi:MULTISPECIES: hypothetical protein [Pseudomonas]|uniref:hypothetical protein n=1 Tax=Pseudomonas TaxID=286 RepID=UPI0010423AFE|nr:MULTISPECIES: hypothetical protein [Pseudomonas]
MDLTDATKNEYDTYMGSRLREYVIGDLARDFRGCEVQIESAGGPHAIERCESREVGNSSHAGSDDIGNQKSKRLGPFPITERVGEILPSALLGVGLLFFVLGFIYNQSEFTSSVCFWIATASLLGGAGFAMQKPIKNTLVAVNVGFCFLAVTFAVIQTLRLFGNA